MSSSGTEEPHALRKGAISSEAVLLPVEEFAAEAMFVSRSGVCISRKLGRFVVSGVPCLDDEVSVFVGGMRSTEPETSSLYS